MIDNEAAKARLEVLREELEQRRDRIAAHGRDGVPADFEEQATARENDDVVASLGVQVDAELNQVCAALDRIEAGSYGNCVRCGESIAARRLDVLPYTPHCTSCSE